MNTPIIRLENVWKVYQLGEVEVKAVRDLSLSIQEEQFVTIVGSSGSGKSTLLHLMGCLDTPTKGKVFLESQNVAQLSQDRTAQIRGQKLGFVFQQFNLLSNLTALENVVLPMIFQNVSDQERQQRARDLLIETGLKNRLDHRPTELSGGERQRVAIARALANDPPLLLADEPTGNLDSHAGKMIMDLLSDLHQEHNKTMVIVTHDPNIAEYSKQVVHMKDGQIVSNHQATTQAVWD